MPFLPAAAMAAKFTAGTLGALLLASLAGDKKSPPVAPPRRDVPIGPPPSRRKTVPDNYPPGSGDAITKPNAQGGMLIRTRPNRMGGAKTNLAAPEGDLHLRPGDHLAVIQTGVKGEDGEGGEWWEVIAPSGTAGFTRAISPTGEQNFNLVRAPENKGGGEVPIAGALGYMDRVSGGGGRRSPFAIASNPRQHPPRPFEPGRYAGRPGLDVFGGGTEQPFRPFGVAYGQGASTGAVHPRHRSRPYDPNRIFSSLIPRGRRNVRVGQDLESASQLMVCAAPAGCWVRSSADPQSEGIALVQPNSQVMVDEYLPGLKREVTSPGHGGWARVRYLGPGMNHPVSGYVLSEWLA